jgi:carbon storage regulator
MEIARGRMMFSALTQEGAAMLVLSRLNQQSIMIGHDIEVKVVDVRGDKVRLGFVAPKSVEILRREIYDQKFPAVRPGSSVDPPRDNWD